MVTHIVMWSFNEELSDAEKMEAGTMIKQKVEALKDIMPGIIRLNVIVNQLEASTRDILLLGEYESEEALSAYQVHPSHLEVGAYIKSKTKDRVCFDY